MSTSSELSPNTFASGDAGEAIQSCPNRKIEGHWIEIELLDEADQPVANEEYCIIDPDGIEHRGFLNTKGFARVGGIKSPGTCQVTFTKLDKDAWE